MFQHHPFGAGCCDEVNHNLSQAASLRGAPLRRHGRKKKWYVLTWGQGEITGRYLGCNIYRFSEICLMDFAGCFFWYFVVKLLENHRKSPCNVGFHMFIMDFGESSLVFRGANW